MTALGPVTKSQAPGVEIAIGQLCGEGAGTLSKTTSMEPQLWVLPRYSASALLAVLVLLLVAYKHTGRKNDPREPRVVGSFVPYIGHILGMILFGGRYTKRLARIYARADPIFTLPMPGARMYIVTDPALASTVQKTKALSFNPIIPEVTRRILGLDDETVKILRTNIGREDGPGGFYPEVHDLIYSTMSPGESLDSLTQTATRTFLHYLQTYVDKLHSNPDASSAEELLQWTQHMVTMATAEFLYGPNNPIASNPSLEAAFWDFDHGLGQLLAFSNIAPSILARRAYQGREALVAALIEYFQAGHSKSACGLVQHRIRIAHKYGMTWDGIARSELSFLFAGIVNTAITSFWLLTHIYANPPLLSSIRSEIQSCTPTPTSSPVTTLPNPSPQLLTTTSSLLLSTYRETLRLGSDNSSARLVTTPTLLADKYLLTTGSILQISGAAMHNDVRIWGDDVDTFDPYRFTPDRAKEKPVNPAAFRAFGGGTTICPGRHFATREILYFVALVLVGFEMVGVDGGAITVPEKKDDVLPVHILEPRGEVNVRVRLRKGVEGDG